MWKIDAEGGCHHDPAGHLRRCVPATPAQAVVEFPSTGSFEEPVFGFASEL